MTENAVEAESHIHRVIRVRQPTGKVGHVNLDDSGKAGTFAAAIRARRICAAATSIHAQ